MLIRYVTASVVALVVACGFATGDTNLPAESIRPAVVKLSHCLVSLIDDVEVPAEKAGVLTSLPIKEGDYLEQGAPVATIDDVQAKHALDAARADHAAAAARAESELEIEYAVATHRTADAEYKIALAANAKQPNTVAAVEAERLRLAAEQARIKIGVTEFDQRVRGIEAGGFGSKAELAAADFARHTIESPLAGEAVEVYIRAGEWVEAGKPIARLVRLDRLRVEGFVRFDELSPADVLHRPVRATIAVAGGRTETFTGRVTFVSPLIQPGGEYRIWAEVDNRRDGDQWLLRPGLEAEMELGEKRS